MDAQQRLPNCQATKQTHTVVGVCMVGAAPPRQAVAQPAIRLSTAARLRRLTLLIYTSGAQKLVAVR